MASKVLDKLLNDESTVQESLAPHLKDAVAKVQKERSERIGTVLVKLLSAGEQAVQENVQSVRLHKRELNKARKQLQNVVEAVDKFKKDGNPFPLFKNNKRALNELCQVLGEPLPEENDPIWQ